MQKEYQNIEDFIFDDTFRDYVLNRDDTKKDPWWERWIADHPEKSALVNEAKKMILLLHSGKPPSITTDKRESWEKIRNGMSLQGSTSDPDLILSNRNKKILTVLKIGASILILVSVGILALWYLNAANNREKWTTAFGETMSFYLPDSTRVFLNANSELTYDGNAWKQNKEIITDVKGEAFFDIKNAENSPAKRFLVKTNDLEIRVSGTAFNVYSRENETSVLVTCGKVDVLLEERKAESSVIVSSNEILKWRDDAGETILEEVDPVPYTAWMNQQFVFNNTSLEDIAHILKNQFGYAVEFVPPELAGRTLTGQLSSREPELLFDIISQTFGVVVEKKGRKVVFRRIKGESKR